jgi:hypothetical protein
VWLWVRVVASNSTCTVPQLSRYTRGAKDDEASPVKKRHVIRVRHLLHSSFSWTQALWAGSGPKQPASIYSHGILQVDDEQAHAEQGDNRHISASKKRRVVDVGWSEIRDPLWIACLVHCFILMISLKSASAATGKHCTREVANSNSCSCQVDMQLSTQTNQPIQLFQK